MRAKTRTMKHGWRAVGVSALMSLAGLMGYGCAEEETGLYILGVARPEPPDCSVRASADGQIYLAGALDVGGIALPGGDVVSKPTSYEASLIVGSQLTPRGDKQNVRTETMVTTIEGTEVRLLRDDGSVFSEYTVPAGGVIAPDDGADPGLGIVFVELIPGQVGAALAEELSERQSRTVIARAKVFGTTLGGIEVESAEFVYVITVCKGCLDNVEPACFEDDPPAVCNDWQDEPTCLPVLP